MKKFGSRFFLSHRSFYERDDKLTPCLSEIKFLDNDCRIIPNNIYSSADWVDKRVEKIRHLSGF
jgi:predicted RNA methylase